MYYCASVWCERLRSCRTTNSHRNPWQPLLLTTEFPAFLLGDISSPVDLTEEPHSRREPVSAPGHRLGLLGCGVKVPNAGFQHRPVTTEETAPGSALSRRTWIILVASLSQHQPSPSLKLLWLRPTCFPLMAPTSGHSGEMWHSLSCWSKRDDAGSSTINIECSIWLL